MPANNFEDSRVSEGTRRHGAYEIGETAREEVPEQIRRDQVLFDSGEAPDTSATRLGGTDDITREGPGGNNTGEANRSETSAQSPRPQRQYRSVLSAGSLVGDRVRNAAGEQLGSIEQIMIDLATGRVSYAVLSFGGFLGIGDKLFAVPWNALRLDEGEQEFVLDVDRKTLENAPGFDKGDWPDMADAAFSAGIHAHYGSQRGAYDAPAQVESASGAPVYEHGATDAGDYIGDNRQPNRSTEFEPEVGLSMGSPKRKGTGY